MEGKDITASKEVFPELTVKIQDKSRGKRRFFRTVVWLLDGVVLVLFVVGYLGRYGSPRYTWWAELVATGLPFISLLLVGATVLVGCARWWKLLAVHGLLVLLATVRFVSLERGAAPGPDDLTLLTFNTSGGGGARADEQGRSITALVRDEAPDLAAFQEAYVEYYPTDQAVRPEERLAALLDALAYRTIGPNSAQQATYTPQPVLARVELVEQTQTMLERDGARKPGRVVRTHFRWQGREAVHYNLHLHGFGDDKPWDDERRDLFSLGFWRIYLRQYRDAYLVRAREIEKICALLDQEHLPLIVSGDFNSTPHNSAFYRLAEGLQDAFKVAGRGWGATYHGRMPMARIDHVLVSPAWQVVTAHVAEAKYSDHRPLIVRLRWRE